MKRAINPTVKDWKNEGIGRDNNIVIALIRNKNVNSFVGIWKPLVGFLHEKEKNEKMNFGFWQLSGLLL